MFFSIVVSVADATVVNPNGTKTLLANAVSTLFLNGKLVLINGHRKLSNSPSWLLIFPAFPLDKKYLYSRKT